MWLLKVVVLTVVAARGVGCAMLVPFTSAGKVDRDAGSARLQSAKRTNPASRVRLITADALKNRVTDHRRTSAVRGAAVEAGRTPTTSRHKLHRADRYPICLIGGRGCIGA